MLVSLYIIINSKVIYPLVGIDIYLHAKLQEVVAKGGSVIIVITIITST